jgi:hypothetical protein
MKARPVSRACSARAGRVPATKAFAHSNESPLLNLQRRAGNQTLSRLFAPGGAHSRLQRQPRPDACRKAPDKLSPGDWVKCVSKGSISPAAANPLRFTATGVIATGGVLVKWMDREGITFSAAVKRIKDPKEFSGTLQAQETAIRALTALIPMEKLSVCIRPVQIADDDGKNPTKLPSFAAAKSIWGKCCIDVSVAAAKTVSKTAFKTLDHVEGSSATTEEQNLITMAGGAGGCISVFIATTFQDGKTISKDISGGAATFGSPFGNVVIAVEGIHPTIVAHELGHAMDYAPHAPAGTVMEVIASKHDQKESDRVSWVICEEVRKFATSAGGKKDCKADVIENLQP